MSGECFHPNAALHPAARPGSGGGDQQGACIRPPFNHRTVQEKREKEEIVSNKEMYERWGGLGSIQTSAATRSARVHVRRVAQPKTTHIL